MIPMYEYGVFFDLCLLVFQVIEGDPSFVQELEGLGFGRVQVNATTGVSEAKYWKA